MTRPHATLDESQRRGQAKQRGRWRGDVESFPCGCPQTVENTISRYGRDHCRRHYKLSEPERTPVAEIGKRFGMLVITAFLNGTRSGRVRVKCDCGNKRTVWISNVIRGSTASCGCTQGTHKHTPSACALAAAWSGPATVEGMQARVRQDDPRAFGSLLRAGRTSPGDYADMVRVRDEARSEKRRRYAKQQERRA